MIERRRGHGRCSTRLPDGHRRGLPGAARHRCRSAEEEKERAKSREEQKKIAKANQGKSLARRRRRRCEPRGGSSKEKEKQREWEAQWRDAVQMALLGIDIIEVPLLAEPRRRQRLQDETH